MQVIKYYHFWKQYSSWRTDSTNDKKIYSILPLCLVDSAEFLDFLFFGMGISAELQQQELHNGSQYLAILSLHSV